MAQVFQQAGIATSTTADMAGWLRTHAALMVPLMAARQALGRDGRLSMDAARYTAAAMHEAFALVRASGVLLPPRQVAMLDALPQPKVARAIGAAFRLGMVRSILHRHAAHGVGELDALLRELRALAPAAHSSVLAAMQAVRAQHHGLVAGT